MGGFEEFLNVHVYSLVHWPFMAAAFVYMTVGEVMKRALWTKQRARTPGRWRWFWYTARVTLPIHPVLTGALTGIVWNDPERYVTGPGALFYFMAAGATSVWLYQILRAVARRHGLQIDPLLSEPPPPLTAADITPRMKPLPPIGRNRPEHTQAIEAPRRTRRSERPTVPFERWPDDDRD